MYDVTWQSLMENRENDKRGGRDFWSDDSLLVSINDYGRHELIEPFVLMALADRKITILAGDGVDPVFTDTMITGRKKALQLSQLQN